MKDKKDFDQNNITILKSGFVTLENFWGEELKKIHIRHTAKETQVMTYVNVANGAIIENALAFSYQLGFDSPNDYWYMQIETLTGDVYQTKENFYCSISALDLGKVTIGINGDAKTMYVHFPVSSDCKTSLNLVSK